MTDEQDKPWVGLADAVRGVRAELQAAMADGAGEDLRFEVGPVELEFAVDVRKERAGDASAKVYVLSFGAKGSAAATSTHRLKFTLQPQDAHGNTAKISGNVPVILAR
ncbi:trypco2 family protein [Streptomyces niveus]|uniref:trypco2 family protein n=1 Tax=Streptomyces niveus TaxID=193462 RepID=UPI003630695D